MPDSSGRPFLSDVTGRGVRIDGQGSLSAGDAWVSMTDAATVAVSLLSGTRFKLTLTGNNHVIGNPSDGEDGDILSLRIDVGSGPYTYSFAGNYIFAFDAAPPISTTANAVDSYDFKYNATTSRWEALVSATDQLRHIADKLGTDDDFRDAFWKTYRFVPVPKGSIRHDNDVHVSKYAASTEAFDGIDDNTTALLNARDAWLTRGTGRLLVPRRVRYRQGFETLGTTGEYDEFGNAFEVCGDGGNMSVMLWDPSSGHEDEDAVTFSGDLGGGEDPSRGCGMRDVMIMATDGIASSCTGAGLRLRTCWHGSFYNIWTRQIAGTGACGFHLSEDSIDNNFYSCVATSNTIGWRLNHANNNNFHGCQANGNFEKGIYVQRCKAVNWFGGLVQGNTTVGVHVAPGGPAYVEGLRFVGIYVELGADNVVAVLHDTNSSNKFVWEGGHIASLSEDAIFFDFDSAALGCKILSPAAGVGLSQKFLRITANAAGWRGIIEGDDEFVGTDAPVDPSQLDIDDDAGARIMWRNGMKIGFGDAPPPAGVCLDLGANKGIVQLPDYTSAERALLTSTRRGSLIWNNTNDQIEVKRNNGAWDGIAFAP